MPDDNPQGTTPTDLTVGEVRDAVWLAAQIDAKSKPPADGSTSTKGTG